MNSSQPPPFDPSKPFTIEGGQTPPLFDPSKPFTTSSSGESAQERVYYNDLGQPFTLSGRAPAPSTPADTGVTGSVLPFRTGEPVTSVFEGIPGTGLHWAVPETITSTIGGLDKARAQASGEAPVTRLLDPEETMALGSFVGTPLMRAPAGTLGAGVADAAVTSTIPGLGGKTTMTVTPKAPVSGLVPGGRLGAAATPGMQPPKPASINPERLNLAQKALTRGIPLTAGSISESGATKVAESQGGRLPLSGTKAHENEVQKAWNRNVAATFGENADRITRDVMNRAKLRIGGVINRIEDSYNVNVDQGVLNRLAEIEQGAWALPEFPNIKRLLDTATANIMPGDQIAGTTYGALFRKGGVLDQAAGGANRTIAHYATEIKKALQDGLQRSLPPEEAAMYQNARFQYKNMMTVRPLAAKAIGGNISPTLLRGRVDVQFPNVAFDVGANPLDELAQIGQTFLKEPPSSFTTERNIYQRAIEGLGRHAGGITTAGAAGAATLGHAGLLPVAIGTGTTLGANRLLQTYLRSPARAERALARGQRRVARGEKPRVPGGGPRIGLGRGEGISSYVRDDRLISDRPK